MKDKKDQILEKNNTVKAMEHTIELQDPAIRKINENLEQITELQKKFEEERRKTEKEIKKVNKMVGELTDGWGKFVEGLVAPSIPQIFKSLGINVFDISPRRTRQKNGNEMEIDVLCIGKKQDGKKLVMITEVKSNLQVKDIDEFLDRLKEFKDFFDEYKNDDVIGIVSGMRFDDDSQRYAEKHGLYVLTQSGNIMKLINKQNFIPTIM